MPRFIPMSREKAIEGIMLAFAEAANAPNNRMIPSEIMHLGAESALVALGVTEEELDQWGKNVMLKLLGVNE